MAAKVRIDGDGVFRVAIVGESHYQDALQAVGRGMKAGDRKAVEAEVIPEKGNRYDPNAVCVQIAGKTVGYIKREQNEQFRRHLTELGHRDATVVCRAQLRRGQKGRGELGLLGVWLDLPEAFVVPTYVSRIDVKLDVRQKRKRGCLGCLSIVALMLISLGGGLAVNGYK